MTDILSEPTVPGMPEPPVEPHVLVVNLLEGESELRFKIECPGVTDNCRTWSECDENGCPVGEDCKPTCKDGCETHGADLDEATAHGISHKYLGTAHIGWGVPSGDCWPATSGEVATSALQLRAAWTPGHYPVRCDLDEYGEHLVLTLIEPERSTTPIGAQVAGLVALGRAYQGPADGIQAAKG